MQALSDKECPEHMTLGDWLFEANGLPRTEFERMSHEMAIKMTKFKLAEDARLKLSAAAKECFSRFGWFGFSNIMSGSGQKRSEAYGGLGLTYSPDYIFDIEPHAQVFGFPRTNLAKDLDQTKIGAKVYRACLDMRCEKDLLNAIGGAHKPAVHALLGQIESLSEDEIREFIEEHLISDQSVSLRLRNTYSDSYAFNAYTDAGNHAPLREFVESFGMQPIRSRLVEMRSHKCTLKTLENMIHRDDCPVYELRVLVCLDCSHSDFAIDVLGEPLHRLVPGDVLVWDTSKPHRATSLSFKEGTRTCLVLGFTPWLNKQNSYWYPNDCFRKCHPVDMVRRACGNGWIEKEPAEALRDID